MHGARKVRKKTDEEEFEIYKVEDDTDTSKPALSIDAIRHLFRGEVHDFVCNKLLPSGQETLSALTERSRQRPGSCSAP